MRREGLVASALAALLAFLIVPAHAFDGRGHSGLDLLLPQQEPGQRSPAEPTQRLDPYAGLGAWIDIYDARPWADPEASVRRMKRHGVSTLFLQTGNYGASEDVFHPRDVATFIEAAHARDIKVVAWYVPSFRKMKRDLRRAKAALRFETRRGHRFDSFGLDIEATTVDSIRLRNRRLLKMSRGIRQAAGRSYPLSAIIPDPKIQEYWIPFPYRRVARIYDVLVPMGYWSFHTHGYQKVRDYTSDNIRILRQKTGRRDVPIHVIGGLAGHARVQDVRGFARAVREHGVLGGSLYDAPITQRKEWKRVGVIARGPLTQRDDVSNERKKEAAAQPSEPGRDPKPPTKKVEKPSEAATPILSTSVRRPRSYWTGKLRDQARIAMLRRLERKARRAARARERAREKAREHMRGRGDRVSRQSARNDNGKDRRNASKQVRNSKKDAPPRRLVKKVRRLEKKLQRLKKKLRRARG